MSLNKFTDTVIKNYLHIGCDDINCNDIKCSSLEINGRDIVPSEDFTDSSSYTPTLSVTGSVIGIYSAYYTYNKNVMTISCNLELKTNITSGVQTLTLSLPPNYTVKLNLERYPASGSMSNYATTAYTVGDTFTFTNNNVITCDFRSNGIQIQSGEYCKISFVGTFAVNAL